MTILQANGREWKTYAYDTLASTQTETKALLARGVHTPFVVRADDQTGGYGRNGRTWTSFPGNLYATLALPVPSHGMNETNLPLAANYSFLAAISVSSTLSRFLGGTGAVVQHKWPNDVWVNGKKISGIILELTHDALLIGMGVNLAGAPEGAISLKDLCGQVLTPEEFLPVLIQEFESSEQYMKNEGFGAILDLWLEKARGLNEEITVATITETFHGVFDGLEPDGALRVLRDGGEKRIIHSADVFFGRDGTHASRG